jgi:hypothetical protein
MEAWQRKGMGLDGGAAALDAGIKQRLIEQMDANRKPGAPKWGDFAITKGAGTMLGDEFVLNGDKVNSAVGLLRDRATAQGPSQWAQLMGQNQDLLYNNAVNDLTATNAANTQGAWSQLAMRGGVSGGERERIAEGGLRGLTDAKQRALAEDKGARLNIGIQDEQNKLGILQGLPQAELAALEPEKYNINNRLNEQIQRRAFEANKYNQQMTAWAANKQADAQAASGKK